MATPPISYDPINWDTTKYVNPSNMNHIDEGILTAVRGVNSVQNSLDSLYDTKLLIRNMGQANVNFDANAVEKNTIYEVNAWDGSVINLPHNWGILETVAPSYLYTVQNFYGANGKVYSRIMQTGSVWKPWMELEGSKPDNGAYIGTVVKHADTGAKVFVPISSSGSYAVASIRWVIPGIWAGDADMSTVVYRKNGIYFDIDDGWLSRFGNVVDAELTFA